MDDTGNTSKKRTIIEEIEVAGDKLVERVKELAKESSVRQMKIVADDGDVFLDGICNGTQGQRIVCRCIDPRGGPETG